MAIRKIKDLAVKTGSYTVNGDTKNRYENIGSIMEGDNGQFLLLKRTFNPAGVPNPDNKDTVLVSIFDPKTNSQSSAPQAGSANGADLNDVPF